MFFQFPLDGFLMLPEVGTANMADTLVVPKSLQQLGTVREEVQMRHSVLKQHNPFLLMREKPLHGFMDSR